MNIKKTNLLFISLFFLAGISIVAGAAEEDLKMALSQGRREEGLEKAVIDMDLATKIIGPGKIDSRIIENFLKELRIVSPESKNRLLGRFKAKPMMIKRLLVAANVDPYARNENSYPALTLAKWSKDEDW